MPLNNLLVKVLILYLERYMADFTKLNEDIAALAVKVDELLAKQNPPPVDEQPAVDAAVAQIEAILAKLA
jgi:t-SNARE complex subunit (syntaxin)